VSDRALRPRQQASLFDHEPGAATWLDGDIVRHADVFEPALADRLFAEIVDTTPWREEHIQMYGREVPIPRLSSWHSDGGHAYTYSGITMDAQPLTPAIAEARVSVEHRVGTAFNSVLANLYRNGRDSVAWHSDDEPELGRNPVIASVSLGATRTFQLRHRTERDQRIDIDLHHGSVLVMRGTTQHVWHHRLPKTSERVGARVNLTFRTVH
jgi:alkylated DNA repair dioxygenase AlkB